MDALKQYISALDARIVARGGTSIFAPRPVGMRIADFNAFREWEGEKLEWQPHKPDPDDGFYRRLSSRGKLHLVRKT